MIKCKLLLVKLFNLENKFFKLTTKSAFNLRLIFIERKKNEHFRILLWIFFLFIFVHKKTTRMCMYLIWTREVINVCIDSLTRAAWVAPVLRSPTTLNILQLGTSFCLFFFCRTLHFFAHKISNFRSFLTLNTQKSRKTIVLKLLFDQNLVSKNPAFSTFWSTCICHFWLFLKENFSHLQKNHNLHSISICLHLWSNKKRLFVMFS